MPNDIKIKEQISPSFNNLNDNSEMFSLLIEAVSDYAIFALDPNGIILSWNSGARRLKGYEASEVIGTHFLVSTQKKTSQKDTLNMNLRWPLKMAHIKKKAGE